MIAAINMQWLGIGIAALVLAALLIVVLIRHRGEDEPATAAGPRTFATPGLRAGAPPGPRAEVPPGSPGWTGLAAAPAAAAPQAPPTPAAPYQAPLAPPAPAAARPPLPRSAAPTGSFLDEPLVHGFEGLGKVATPAKPVSSGPFPVDPFGSHDDIFPAETPAGWPNAASTVARPAAAAEPEPAPTPAAAPVDPFGSHEDIFPAERPAAAPDADSTVTRPGPAEPAAATPAAPDDPAPLSDIIVTSDSEEIDLADPDVRELLTQLVDDEIELAKACRAQGQILDAILQLTEAEKASAALGLDDRLATVKALLAELQA